MDKRFVKIKPDFWQVPLDYSENAFCALLIAGGVFHGSEYAQSLGRLLRSQEGGRQLVLTVQKVDSKAAKTTQRRKASKLSARSERGFAARRVNSITRKKP